MEGGLQTKENHKLPPLHQSSQGRLPTQHRLDTLIKDISNKGDPNKVFLKKNTKREKEITGQSSKILLKSVSSVNRLTVRKKGEGRDQSDLNKYQPLASKTVSSGALMLENGDCQVESTPAQTVRVSVTLKDIAFSDIQPQFSSFQQQKNALKKDMQHFLSSHLACGVTLRAKDEDEY